LAARPRASDSEAPPRRKTRKKKGGAAKGPRKAPAGGWIGRLGRWLAKLVISVGLGATVGLGFVTWVMYRQAVKDVESLLSKPVWSTVGRVYSGPLELWPGLTLDPEALAIDLQAAGYARVRTVEKAGDFQIDGEDILLRAPSANKAGEATAPVDTLLSFSKGRLNSITPGKRVTLRPVELAALRGPNNEDRRPVALQKIPKDVVHAVLAMEDARFYQHEGLDPIGIARALLHNAMNPGGLHGGSTLTQQVVKNVFLTQERTYERKAKEAILAIALEQVRSKDQIIELYLNEIYLGQANGRAICGVDEAARAFFGKPIDRVDLAEAATLAGVVAAPNRYSPLQHPDESKVRRDLALDRMVEVGFVTKAAAGVARSQPLAVHPSSEGRRAPWAVDAAVDRVEAALGAAAIASRGLQVHTTLHPVLQRLAERAVAEGAAELDKAHPKAKGAQIALVVVRARDGAVLAAVGGRDYATSQFDRALVARRQIGSTIKPLTFLAAFERWPDRSPATRVTDEPITRTVAGKEWAPKNYDGTYVGAVSYRRALEQSRNIPAILVAEELGMTELAALWRKAGLSEASSHPAAALGAFTASPLELAGAYTVFPNLGSRQTPHLVRVANAPDGASLWSEPTGKTTVASPRAAFLTTSLLQGVLTDGTARSAAKTLSVTSLGGKTGTTDDGRDAWFVGFSPELVVVVWVGFDRDKALGLTGGEAALPTWTRFLSLVGAPRSSFVQPPTVARFDICAESGVAPDQACAAASEWFSREHPPAPGCPVHGGPVDQVGEAVERGVQKVKEVVMPEEPDRPRIFKRKEKDTEPEPAKAKAKGR
jgi:penicillin-binding protein 1B